MLGVCIFGSISLDKSQLDKYIMTSNFKELDVFDYHNSAQDTLVYRQVVGW